MAKVQNLSEMLAKRKEELGSKTRFEWPVDDKKSFWVLDPKCADQPPTSGPDPTLPGPLDQRSCTRGGR